MLEFRRGVLFQVGMALLVGVAGCNQGEQVLEPALAAPLETLRAAPETVSVGESVLRLETFIWRDFMPGPGATPDGSPMMASLRVISVDSQPIPSTLVADLGWIIWNDQVWEAPVVEDPPRQPGATELDLMMRGGPKWGPDIYVDAVVRVIGADGASRLLRARQQRVTATW